MARKILITGASGNIGAKLAAHFRTTGQYELVLIDRVAGPGINAAELAVYDPAWASLFTGVDTVLHLAGEPRGTSSFAMVRGPNIDGLYNVLRASREAGVRRVVFASTNQVMLGYRFRGLSKVTTDLPPAPLSPYGITKLFGEELGRCWSADTGISFLALRIGYFQRGDNVPGPHMGIGAWGQAMWLSNRDMLHAAERAIEAEGFGFAVVNLMSDNPGMPWDLDHTRKTIGYAPQEGHALVMDDKLRAEDAKARSAAMTPGSWFDEYFTDVEG